jgi:hypothetical protein
MALDPYAELPALEDALKGTDFEDSVECLNRVFEQNGIKTVDAMDNSPRYLTCSVCGCSTHRLIQQVRAYMEGVKEGSVKEPDPEPEPIKEPEVEAEPVVEEPEPEKEEPEVKRKTTKSRSSRRSKKE